MGTVSVVVSRDDVLRHVVSGQCGACLLYTSILALLSARLQQRESRYAVLFDLLLKLANTAIDSDKVAEKIADEDVYKRQPCTSQPETAIPASPIAVESNTISAT